MKTSEKFYTAIIFAIIFGVFATFGFSQTNTIESLDKRITRIEDSLGINNVIDPPPPPTADTNIVLPTYQGIILSGQYDIYPSPYSPMFKDKDNLYKLFIQKQGLPFAVGSANGLNNWTFSSTGNMPRGTVLKIDPNLYLAMYHKWYNTQCWYYSAGSTNSYNWSDMSLIRIPYGEDITFIRDLNHYKAYGRMAIPPAKRTIGVMTSNDLRTFTPLREVLTPDALDASDEFYSVSVIKTPKGYYGFLNVFDPISDLVEVQLIYSQNGEDNWERLNNRNPFLIKKDGAQCLYACASVIGEEAYIATITANFNHEESNRNGKYYYTALYKIKLTDLYKSNNK